MARRHLLLVACGALVSCNMILGMGDLETKKKDAGTDDDWPEFDSSYARPDAAPYDPGDGAVVAAKKRVFLTSATFAGNFGSVQAADGKCRDLAQKAGLTGEWIAWLSAPGSKAIDALTFDGPYELVSGVQIAANKQTLITGPLSAPINAFEDGGKAPSSNKVWTGTRKDGNAGEACANSQTTSWDSNSPVKLGTAGDMDQTDGRWTDNGGQPLISSLGWTCNLPGRLYCFEK